MDSGGRAGGDPGIREGLALPDALPILTDFADAVERNGQHFAAHAEGERKVVPVFHLKVVQGLENDVVIGSVVDPDFEISPAEFLIPADPAQ